MSISTVTARRVGRPCAVCSLDRHQRTALELALARGISITRLSRQHGAPSRDSIRRHILSGHLPAELQDAAERSHGLDWTSYTARVSDIARRAREAALEAREQGNLTALIRAGDAELRAVQVLAHVGADHEQDIELASASQDVFRAVISVAKKDATTAERIARELENMGLVTLAEDVRSQDSGNREITT